MRVRIPLPDQWDFTTDLTVRVSDLNYGAHLANDRILSLAQEARVRWLQSHGWSEFDLGGVGLIQVDAAIQYKAQGFLGDSLRISLQITETSTRGFRITYQITRKTDSVEIARISTNILFFNYQSQNITNTPISFSDRYKRP